MKNIVKLIFLLLPIISVSQETNKEISIMAGYKAIELQYSYTVESELIFGGSVSATESKVVQDIINKNDQGKKHLILSDVIPTVFGLVGAKFDNFSIIGKFGVSYFEQEINYKKDNRPFYPTVGVIFDYKFNNDISLKASYDGVSGPKAGIGFNF